MSFANSELLPHLGGWTRPILGKDPYNKKSVEESLTKAKKALDVLEKHLLINTFLVGERLTLADLFTTGILDRAFQYFFDQKNRKAFPCLTRYYETISNQQLWTDAVPKITYPTEMLKNQQPKVESKKLPVAKPKPAAAQDEEDEPKPEPKAKHPLEALGKPTLILDDWKRKYSNAETRTEALPWFWENFKPDEYSLWQVDYKYNDELTMTFMTANLIGKCISTA
jgi:elongation factor 1-gamma